MIVLGAVLLSGLAVFLKVALDYRHSFTSSDVPLGDLLEGLAMLLPVAAIAGGLIFFGLRWRRA